MIYNIPIRLIPIQSDGFHLSIPASLSDSPIHMLIDTGASRTVFDFETIRKLFDLTEDQIEENPGPSGGIGSTELESSITFIPCINIGGLVLENYQAALIDLSQVNRMLTNIGLQAVDGILGGDILQLTRAVIDYGSMNLRLRSPQRKKRKK